MLVTLFGSLILVRLLQSPNTQSPMDITLFGSLILVRLLQPLKAKSPMLVTLSGIYMSINPSHSEKASSGISVMPYFIRTCVILVTGLSQSPANCTLLSGHTVYVGNFSASACSLAMRSASALDIFSVVDSYSMYFISLYYIFLRDYTLALTARPSAYQMPLSIYPNATPLCPTTSHILSHSMRNIALQ